MTPDDQVPNHSQVAQRACETEATVLVEQLTHARFGVESLSAAGFRGFVPIASLMRDNSPLPAVRGVYMLVRRASDPPVFLEIGSGGHFKDKDPNVGVEVLRNNWIEGSAIMYIGKAGDPGSAATLRSRLGQYLKFGAGRKIGHWGGRYVWQLADAKEIEMCWLPLPAGTPSQVESDLIAAFRTTFGDRPFANLTK